MVGVSSGGSGDASLSLMDSPQTDCPQAGPIASHGRRRWLFFFQKLRAWDGSGRQRRWGVSVGGLSRLQSGSPSPERAQRPRGRSTRSGRPGTVARRALSLRAPVGNQMIECRPKVARSGTLAIEATFRLLRARCYLISHRAPCLHERGPQIGRPREGALDLHRISAHELKGAKHHAHQREPGQETRPQEQRCHVSLHGRR